MISREFTFRFPSSLSAQDVNEINDVFVLNRGCTNSTPHAIHHWFCTDRCRERGPAPTRRTPPDGPRRLPTALLPGGPRRLPTQTGKRASARRASTHAMSFAIQTKALVWRTA